MVAILLGAIPSFRQLHASRSDDAIDRLCHVYTVFILVIFGVVVSTGQFVGDPIHCWVPAEFTGAFQAYAKSYCWIKNTYFIPMMEVIPVDIAKRQVGKVAGLLGAIPSAKQLNSSRSDDWIDRMNHVYTTFGLIVFAVLVSTGQFVGEPITCWVPAEWTGAFEGYTKNYCWIKNTYYIPLDDVIPRDIHKRQVRTMALIMVSQHHFLFVVLSLLSLLLSVIEPGVAGLLGAVPSFKKLSSSRSDDWIDRMSHIYTVFLLVIFAVLVSTGQFVGDPIHCWCPAQFTGAFEAYTKNYCWIKNTYYIPMMESIPIDIHKRQEAEITYYQWVPLILLFQAFLFKFPNVIWKMLNGGSGLNLDKICKLADETQWGSPDDRKSAIENMSFFLDRWLLTHRQYKHNFVARAKAKASRIFCFLCNKREGTFLTALYLSVKVFYLANVIGQFFLLNAFMATDYNLYGFEYVKMLQSGESMRESPRFPRVTLCDFRIRQLQNIQRWTVQCVLPINLFNEKIFIFLWFWFFFIAFLCAFNLFKWMFLIVFKRNNYQYVKKYLTITEHMQTASDKKLCRRFADGYLRDDGCFVARMIGMNATDMVITDLLDCMWRNYRLREEPRQHDYPEDEEEKLIDKEKTSPLDFRGNNVS